MIEYPAYEDMTDDDKRQLLEDSAGWAERFDKAYREGTGIELSAEEVMQHALIDNLTNEALLEGQQMKLVLKSLGLA